MAKGGIVTKPMNAVIGEAGPEAVIPLNRAQQYSQLDQREDSKDMVMELKKQLLARYQKRLQVRQPQQQVGIG